jgi:hypothetical protein
MLFRSLAYNNSDGSGDTGPRKSEAARLTTPEVVFRSTSGRRKTVRTDDDQVPYEFPGRAGPGNESKPETKFVVGPRNAIFMEEQQRSRWTTQELLYT